MMESPIQTPVQHPAPQPGVVHERRTYHHNGDVHDAEGGPATTNNDGDDGDASSSIVPTTVLTPAEPLPSITKAQQAADKKQRTEVGAIVFVTLETVFTSEAARKRLHGSKCGGSNGKRVKKRGEERRWTELPTGKVFVCAE